MTFVRQKRIKLLRSKKSIDVLFRPSGTEDIVRVYAECENSSDVNKLAMEIASLVYRLAGGVGPESNLS